MRLTNGVWHYKGDLSVGVPPLYTTSLCHGFQIPFRRHPSNHHVLQFINYSHRRTLPFTTMIPGHIHPLLHVNMEVIEKHSFNQPGTAIRRFLCKRSLPIRAMGFARSTNANRCMQILVISKRVIRRVRVKRAPRCRMVIILFRSELHCSFRPSGAFVHNNKRVPMTLPILVRNISSSNGSHRLYKEVIFATQRLAIQM